MRTAVRMLPAILFAVSLCASGSAQTAHTPAVRNGRGPHRNASGGITPTCVTGTRNGTYTDNAGGESGVLTATLTETGNQIAGDVEIVGAPGTASPGVFDSSITGTAGGGSVTMGPAQFGNEIDNAQGTLSSDCGTMSGNFVNPGGNIAGTFSATKTTYNVTLYDPQPNMLQGPAVSQDPGLLAAAASASIPVQGAATDGVTQVVIQIEVENEVPADPIQVNISDEDCPNAQDNPLEDGSIQMVGQGYVDANSHKAFAIYTAPMDFVRNDCSGDNGLASRVIELLLPDNSTVPLLIVRPPVLLVHGVWSDPSTWDGFPLKSDTRFATYTADYSPISGNSVMNVEQFLLSAQVPNKLWEFKVDQQVAAIQFDVIAHSMGGLVSRAMTTDPNAFSDPDTYGDGYIHKLITIDSPHNGTPMAVNMLASISLCKNVFANIGKPIAGAITDFAKQPQPGTQVVTLDYLNTNSNSPNRLPAHGYSGQADTTQQQASIPAITALDALLVCSAVTQPILNTGYAGVFNNIPNDLLVDINSQQYPFLAYGPSNAFDNMTDTIHSFIFPIFPVGPGAIQNVYSQPHTPD